MPRVKIPVAAPSLGKEEMHSVVRAVASGWISSKGKFIEEFEEGFSKYCGVKYGIATANGTVALHLALTALGIKKGDEVIIPALTYVATANVAAYCNAKPVFVEAHSEYWCMDPARIEEKITKRTRAIITVHLYGHPCDMRPILTIARKHNLYVVEDAAEAHGAEYRGKKVGSFGDVSCFSFFGNKVITTGEGGMCLTNREELARKMRILRNQGADPKKRYWYGVIGFNYRMTNIQAAIGVAQVKKLGAFIRKKRQIAAWYARGFKGLADGGLVGLPPEMPWAKSTYWMYSILINDVAKHTRDEVIKGLAAAGIESRPFFYPVHMLPMYKSEERFPVAEAISRRGINLPSGVNLKEQEVAYVVKSLKKLLC